MKPKLTFTLAILFSIFSRVSAQNTDLSYTEMADTLLYPLNKSYITTGILYDRVYPFASLQDFNSTQVDTSNYLHIIQAYSELYRSAYNKVGMMNDGYLDTVAKAIRFTDNVIHGAVGDLLPELPRQQVLLADEVEHHYRGVVLFLFHNKRFRKRKGKKAMP